MRSPGQRILILLTLGLLSLPAIAQSEGTPAFDTVEYDKAVKMILCDCGCHPQSVHDCACGRAAEMRAEIRELISQGMTGDEVIARYVNQVGDHIRIVPEASGFNLVAWLGPLLALLAGSVLMYVLIRRWTRQTRTEAGLPAAAAAAAAGSGSAAAGSQPPDPAHEAYRRRLADALEDLE